MTDKQKDFIETVGKLTQADSHASQILPSLTIAQAILESSWGKSGLTVKANALFGIKATSSWTGRVYGYMTQECYDGVRFITETAYFRAYGSWAESIADHGNFLCELNRYKAVIGETDYKAACKAIHAAGYATDPTYADKLISLIETYGLTQYDSVTVPETPPCPEQCPDTAGVRMLADEIRAGTWGTDWEMNVTAVLHGLVG